ncbi:MAG: PAC2 family protein [Dehalococcoidia bacterium]
MSDLEISATPELRRPLLIAAFTGWNDAGEAASAAVRFMHRRWRSEVIANIDPENFFDFTQARPHVRLERGDRVIDWPANVFSAKRLDGLERDVIMLAGTEPHLGWHAYTDAVLEVCTRFEVSGVITLGALLAEVSHARPVRVTGSATDDDLGLQLSIPVGTRSTYQGPTGIVGAIGQAARAAGLPTASLWANMPFYVQRTPNPKGTLALLSRLNSGLSLDLTLHDLEVFAARFEAQVAADIEGNPEIAAYARRVASEVEDEDEDEELSDEPAEELPDAASMVDELERYLREQRSDESP